MKKCLRKKCQKEFEPKKPKAKFCSDKCRVYFSREEGSAAKVVSIKGAINSKKEQLEQIIADVAPSGIKFKNKDKSTETDKKTAILKLIKEIEAERIPKERDTRLGRSVWYNDQRKRIIELENQIK